MEEIGSFCVNPDTHKKYAPVIVADERGAKNDIRFFSAARSLQSRSYAAGGTRYLQADLMLLTHAGCAFKDPRGRFGISDILPCTLFAYSVRADGLKSDALRRTKRARVCTQNQMPFVLRGSQFRTAALRSNRQCGAAAPLICGSWVPPWLRPGGCRGSAYLYRSTRRVRCS